MTCELTREERKIIFDWFQVAMWERAGTPEPEDMAVLLKLGITSAPLMAVDPPLCIDGIEEMA